MLEPTWFRNQPTFPMLFHKMEPPTKVLLITKDSKDHVLFVFPLSWDVPLCPFWCDALAFEFLESQCQSETKQVKRTCFKQFIFERRQEKRSVTGIDLSLASSLFKSCTRLRLSKYQNKRFGCAAGSGSNLHLPLILSAWRNRGLCFSVCFWVFFWMFSVFVLITQDVWFCFHNHTIELKNTAFSKTLENAGPYSVLFCWFWRIMMTSSALSSFWIMTSFSWGVQTHNLLQPCLSGLLCYGMLWVKKVYGPKWF